MLHAYTNRPIGVGMAEFGIVLDIWFPWWQFSQKAYLQEDYVRAATKCRNAT